MTDEQEFKEWREFQEWKKHKQTQTIEQTGKGWKAVILIGGIFLLIGLPTMAIDVPIGGSMTGLGLATYLIGRIGAWWYHG